MFYKTVDDKTTDRLVNIHLLCFSRNISTLNMLVSACVSKTSFDILPLRSFCADKDHSWLQCVWVHTVLESTTKTQILESLQTFGPV